ncbi:MSMEG_1061 family FMN-dependent PPOX-type flavoprotein [Pseudooceanicola sp. C21-150M6]|uniref:MSMEG_1061 family FMN-dependent PPOX-type flavoprotein n=1 Tax=Pseudooceanicola sp. C21-150M6 TaxID=3434355 RepID=UPI003D7FAF7C
MSQTVFGRPVDRHFDTVEALREEYRMPSEFVRDKEIDHIDDLARRFIAASPLAILTTRRPDGSLDVTPRGDPPGFIQVLDDKTLALPDRPGNYRMDAHENVMRTGHIGLLFLIPGHGDTLRVRGHGAVVRDAPLSKQLAVNGRPAGLVTLIRVDQVLSHCPKAFIRSRAWQPEHWPDTSDVPTLAEMMKVHSQLAHSLEELDDLIHTSNTDQLY